MKRLRMWPHQNKYLVCLIIVLMHTKLNVSIAPRRVSQHDICTFNNKIVAAPTPPGLNYMIFILPSPPM